jgi:hypothetical protein
MASEELKNVKRQWRSNPIYSNWGSTVFWFGFFALAWNSMILLFVLMPGESWIETFKSRPLTLMVLAFPAVGLGLIFVVVRICLRQLKFGKSPMTMDPFPGSIRGHIGGHIETSVPYDQHNIFNVSVTCHYHYRDAQRTHNINDHRSRVSIAWRSIGVCDAGPTSQVDAKPGTRLSFRFDIPYAPMSSLKQSGNHHTWTLEVVCKRKGLDFVKVYDIPVLRSGKKSESVMIDSVSHPLAMQAAKKNLSRICKIRKIPAGLELFFPPQARFEVAIVPILFGLAFMASGAGVTLFGGGSIVFVLGFGLLGLFPIGLGLDQLTRSTLLKINRNGLLLNVKSFFVNKSTSVSKREFDCITHNFSEGGGSFECYQLLIKTRSKKEASIVVSKKLFSPAEAVYVDKLAQKYLPRSLPEEEGEG